MSEISFVSDSSHVIAWQQKAEQFNPATLPGVDEADPYGLTSLRQAAAECVATYQNMAGLTPEQRTAYCRFLGQALRKNLGGTWVELLDDATHGEFAIYLPELEAIVPPLALLEQVFEDVSAWEEIAAE